MSDAPPPAYHSSSTDQPIASGSGPDVPHTYALPTHFTIGSATTREPLVSIVKIKGHLALLHAFAELKNQVESTEVGLENVPTDKERKWSWFVGLAVERFDIWCQKLKASDASEPMNVVLPPIDVLMVWHSYMLNPRWYAEDCIRINECKTLKRFEGHFVNLLDDPSSIFSEPPSKARVKLWRSRTALSFDPFEGMYEMTSKRIFCPKCMSSIRVDFMNELGTGYLQQKFSAICTTPDCEIAEIRREMLALPNLAKDLMAKFKTASDFIDPPSHLPGTFFAAPSLDASNGNEVKRLICEAAKKYAQFSQDPDIGPTWYTGKTPLTQKQLYLAILKRAAFSLAKLRAQMVDVSQPPLIGRIMKAYNDDKRYSVELVGAVLRQGSFVGKMYDLGWTRPGYFDNHSDEMVLQHALARYHAFLDLMSTSPALFCVPTLDIDLVWHTHQLLPAKYNSDCHEFLERFMDHDDKVEGLRLSSAFDNTCRAWKERFHVPYMHCGCPVPGETIGQCLFRIVGMYSPPPAPPSHLIPVERPDLLSATHPSGHNAVRLVAKGEYKINGYDHLAKKKEKEREKAAKKAATLNPGAARKTAKNEKDYHSASHNNDGLPCAPPHDIAFLVPVPMFFGKRLASLSCVAPGGSFVSPVSGGCSNCGSGGGCGGGMSNAGVCKSGG